MTDHVQARELAAMEQRALAAEARVVDSEHESVEALAKQSEYFFAAYSSLESRALAAEAEAKRLREALAEVQRRAGLPIRPSVTGLPATEEEVAAAVAECARLVVEHVTEPARAALEETR